MAHTTATPPGLLSVPRITTLIASSLVALCSGTNYVYSAYAPQLGSRLQISHTQLNIIGLAGNVGVYGTAPFLGRIVDARGPRILLAGAFVMLLAGYSGIRYLYNDAEGSMSTSWLTFCALVFFSFMTGVGGDGGLTSSINVTAKNFPERARATTTGLVLSGFGLSAFFFSTIAHVTFGGDVSSFLLLLSLGTSIPMIFGFFFVRLIPLPEPMHIIENGPADGEYDETAVTHVTKDTQTPLLSPHDDRDDDDDDDDSTSPHALELSSTRSILSSASRHRSRSSASRHVASRVANAVDRLPNIHGMALVFCGDFWILFITLSLLSGTGLMYINNVGSMSLALSAHGDSSYDEKLASRWQATQVSTVSVMNFLGRILIGVTSDFAKNRLHYPRSYCIPLVAFLFLVSQIAVIMIHDVSHLWRASALVGLAFGSMFGLFPTVCIQMFGLAHLSENWGYLLLAPMLGGNLFSLIIGYNLDAHAPPDGHTTLWLSSSSDHQCLGGRDCYVGAFYVTIVASIVALIMGIWVGWRERRTLKGTSKDLARGVLGTHD